MAKKEIDVTFHSNKKEYEEALEEVAEKVLTMWGMEAETAAKKRAPVDTGLLRNSISWAVAGESVHTPNYKASQGNGQGSYSGKAPDDPGGARHVYIGSNVEYAMAQENGNFKDGPHAFLRPAIDENREHFKNILETELKNAMNNDSDE